MESRRALRMLLKENKRLHKAYLLKESFGQLWDYNNPTWARKFFERWKGQLRWQRLKSFEKLAVLSEQPRGRNRQLLQSYKVSLGCMEGLKNKIRVIQRKAYGIKVYSGERVF
jgi:transposase